jgi:hypothetical protein
MRIPADLMNGVTNPFELDAFERMLLAEERRGLHTITLLVQAAGGEIRITPQILQGPQQELRRWVDFSTGDMVYTAIEPEKEPQTVV